MEAFMGAASAGRVALGPSTSQLLASLGECYAQLLGPGDEVVVQESNHESNAGPWVRCAGEACPQIRLHGVCVWGGGGGVPLAVGRVLIQSPVCSGGLQHAHPRSTPIPT